MLNGHPLSFFDFHGLQLSVQPVLVVGLGEHITVIYNAITAKYIDMGANSEVLNLIVLLLGQTHARIVGKNGFLGQFLLAQEERVGVSSRILVANFFDFDSAVGQIEVQSEVIVASF